MVKIPVYNLVGEKVKEIEVSSRIFARKIKPEVVHQVVVAQESNARKNYAHTKDRSEIRGGGKKPWKQKGTGRARHGSTRSPIWIGGGVTFGPTKDRNFSKAVNKRQKQLAMAMCLSDRINDKALTVLETIKLDSGKTKDLNNLIIGLKDKITGLKDKKKVLLVLDSNDKNIIQASKNLDKIRVILADSLNCIDILKHDLLFVSEKAIEIIDKHYKRINESKNN